MKRKGKIAALAAILILEAAAIGLPRAADGARIAGRWWAMDSDLVTRRALIVIAPDGNDFVGTVVEIHAAPGEDADPVCAQCAGADRNRKVKGLAILFLGTPSTNGEYRGSILDPEDGDIYRCVVTLDPLGRRLTLRGYVGLPLLGRTESWLRAP